MNIYWSFFKVFNINSNQEVKPFDLESMAHRKVKYILQKQNDLCEAFRDRVLPKDCIDHADVIAWVDHIESCELTVGEYLKENNL